MRLHKMYETISLFDFVVLVSVSIVVIYLMMVLR